MKLLRCPINGWRPLSEFVYGGELRPMPDPATTDDRTWADYVFHRRGEPAVLREWWYHVPSGTWFVAERDTVRDEVRATWLWPPPVTEAPASASGSSEPPTAAQQPTDPHAAPLPARQEPAA
jgi:sarcosine oxidase subunit delta